MQLIPTQTALAASASLTSPLRDNVIERIKSARFRLTVSSAANAVTDLLDVYLQSRPQGTTGAWHDFVHFTQVLGNGGAVEHVASWSRAIAPDAEMGAQAAESLPSGSVLQGPVENEWRVRAVVTDVDAPLFTFDVFADPEF